MKKCSCCRITKNNEFFSLVKSTGTKYRAQCKDCRSKIQSEKYCPIKAKLCTPRTPEVQKNCKLKRMYGLTLIEYNEKLRIQNNVCDICHMPETVKRNGKVKALAVDHNKYTGKVRGLLCQKCNQAFGLLQEETTIMLSMIDYNNKY